MLEQEYAFYLADNDAGKSIHYGLRYQVYCLREKYEDASNHPNYFEQDEFDDISAHFIARSRITGEWLGAMRLIVGPVHNLPVTKYSSVNPANFSRPAWRNVAEASRLCTLLPTSPRSSFTSNSAKAPNEQSVSRTCAANTMQTSWIAMGLIRAARHYCLIHEITYCFFLISDPLARMLRRLGMDIDPVGSPCQHRGWRRPYIHNVKTGYRIMHTRSPELYRMFCQAHAYSHYSELVEDFEPAPIAAIG
jgi:N-acyl amino acid synthase of PEP-CTERM/exosortase system